MKKYYIIIIALCTIFSAKSYAQSAYGEDKVTVVVKPKSGKVIIQWDNEDNGGTCSDKMRAEYITMQIGSQSPLTIFRYGNIYNGDGYKDEAGGYHGITFYPPGHFFSQTSIIRFRGQWGECNCSSICNDRKNKDFSYTLNNQIDAPNNVTASVDTYCDRIRLTWNDGYNVAGASVTRAKIFRNNVEIASGIAGNSFDDMSPGYGDVNYRVQTYMEYNLYYVDGLKFGALPARFSYGEKSPVITGRKYAPPVDPSGLYLDQANCSGQINVNWNWTAGTNPSNFIVERADDANFDTNKTSNAVSGSDRSRRETGSNSGQKYFFRVYAQDDCPSSSSLKALSGASLTESIVGNGIPAAPTNVTAAANPNGTITVNWSDNGNLEDGFKIVRQSSSGQVLYDAPADATSYVDQTADACTPYTYYIKSYNSCKTAGVQSASSSSLTVPASINNTFTGSNGLTASDGEFGDKIELRWVTDNRQIDDWFISRKNLATNVSTIIGNPAGGTRYFVDNSASANTLYEYEIKGATDCAGSVTYSNTVTDNGFRLAFGTINGQITFDGGTAVQGVKVAVEAASGASGNSASFNGLNSSAIAGNQPAFQSNELTVSTFIKPANLTGTKIISSKYDNGNGWQFYLQNNTLSLKLKNQVYSTNHADIIAGTWFSVAAIVANDSVKLFVNGDSALMTPNVGNLSALNTTSSFVIGTFLGFNNFNGFIDEFRYFNTALTTDEFQKTHDVYINPSYANLVAYYRFDEGFGNTGYDYSKLNQTLNANNLILNNLSFSPDKPSSNKLSAGAYSDAQGSYFVPFVPYLGSGDNYIITPTKGTHSFSPATKSLFIGGNSPNFSGIDFTDNSSFRVTGHVLFDNTNIYTCGSKEVLILVDDKVVMKEGTHVMSNSDGFFDFQVPIGRHVLTTSKTRHTFSAGRFPPTGTHDFQQNVNLIQFKDATLAKVVGQVAGGAKQEAIFPGFGHGKNNIGIATITFSAACFDTTVTTDPLTGEYSIELPPMNYNIPNFTPTNNTEETFNSNADIDLRFFPAEKKVYDTVLGIVDSLEYHMIRNFITYNSPTVTILSENNDLIYGESFIEFEDQNGIVPIPESVFNYPVFKENTFYKWNILAMEEYKNKDNSSTNPVIDNVPITEGKFTFINELASPSTQIIKIKPEDNFTGELVYRFRAGQANTSTDPNPNYSFTKTMSLSVVSERGNFNPVTYAHYPGVVGPASLFRGIVFGGKSLGNSYTSAGPQVVTMILRDPPGTNSFATWEQNIDVTTVNTYEYTDEGGVGLQGNEAIGTEFTSGVIGYETETKVTTDLTRDYIYTASINEKGEHVLKQSRSTSISTGNGDEFVGSDADLFFGRSMNMEFGLAQVIGISKASDCGGNVECIGSGFLHNGVTYKFSRVKSLVIVPGGYETTFLYHQGFVESGIMPRLILLRNQLLTSPNNEYTSKLPATDPDFGKSNDDPTLSLSNGASLSSLNPETFENNDTTGYSYTFTGINLEGEVIERSPGQWGYFQAWVGIDSVWWYNQQIRLWQDALKANEEAKFTGDLETNISYSGGSILTNSVSSSNSINNSTTISLGLDRKLTLEITSKVAGVGTVTEQTANIKMGTVNQTGTTVDTNTTFSYTIDDPGSYDDFSFDVFKPRDGFGPVFRTRGGKTQCPHQDEEVTNYFQPGRVINARTEPVDQPRINATPPEVFNVPADGSAVINLTLINDATVDNVYTLTVLESSNPNGALLQIDGEHPNRDFAVSAGTSINKTLIIQKGPYHIKYDSIALVYHSRCQYSFNSSNWTDIGDTVYISVNFLPSCTDIEITNPSDQFVINNTYDNEIPFVISGYDINYGGLDKIGLQYKPASQSTWIPLATEWFMDSTGKLATVPPHPDPKAIPKDRANIDDYSLNIEGFLTDQEYQFRATTTCKIPGNADAVEYSGVVSGIVDRVDPNVFGVPSPGDGVLDPNDNISIKFNEPISIGELNTGNFELTGVLNGQDLRHDKTIAFDGSTTYMEIGNGFDFASGSFTLEFWAKRAALGTNQTILSQGLGTTNAFLLRFNANDNLELSLGNVSHASTFQALDDTTWRHYSITYDREHLIMEFSDRTTSNTRTNTISNVLANYSGGGKTFVGKKSDGTAYFNGSMHQLRIWNKVLSLTEIASKISKNLSGREPGLIGYWPMDEGKGVLAEDKSRFRHAEMHANWEINPKGASLYLNGNNQYAVLPIAGNLSVSKESDLSIEFWFKTSGGNPMTFLSNGSGRFLNNDLNANGWSIEMDANDTIHVKNDGLDFRAVSNSFADNQWHHFALVVNRLTNATAYIDGLQQNTVNSSNFNGFGGSKLAIGARYAYLQNPNQNLESFDQYFNGYIDEIRIWNSARLAASLELDMYNRLSGNEFGLMAYYPFESYELQLGVPILTPGFDDGADTLDLTAENGALTNSVTPAIALHRPVQNVNYSKSVNLDEIVITPNEDPANLENVTLSVTVRRVKDLHGNKMQSPKTWVAYVNKNQVLWQDASKNLVKELNDTMTFTSRIVNSGGENKNFTISNLPVWLTANPSSGTITPLSTQVVRFTVNPATNIGKYSEDVMLATDFGYNEKLLVNLKVEKTAPSFAFDPTQFQNSMSIIAQLRINGKISVNPDDKLIALINDSIRGVAELQYIESYDKYVAFLDVYANAADSVNFQIWNASKGELHIDVKPNIYFVSNALKGSVANPQFFDAEDKVAKEIVLKQGWNWVSFPLYSEEMSNFYNFLSPLNFADRDAVKTTGDNTVAVFSNPSGWSGGLIRDGFIPNKSYLIKISNTDTLDYKGFAIDPDTIPIPVDTGWNRIGFVSLKNLSINTALANYPAHDGDLLKSQLSFAYFDQNLGWIGSLKSMEPTKGYLLLSNGFKGDFVYPRNGLLRMKEAPQEPSLQELLPADYNLNEMDYEASTSAIVEVNTCEEILKDQGYGLAAFCNGEYRGWANASVELPNGLGYRYFLTAYGQGMEKFNFVLYNKETKDVIDLIGDLYFAKDQLEGTPSSPLVLETMKAIDCNQFKTPNAEKGIAIVYPNPFTREINILVPEEMKSNTKIDLIDESGRILYSDNSSGRARVVWTNDNFSLSQLSSGIYQIRLTSGEQVIVEKMVKL